MGNYDARDSKILKAAWTQLGDTQSVSEFLNSVDILDIEQKELIVEQALTLTEQLYVHLPLKQARHAVNPIQQLQLLRQQLGDLGDSSFHHEMIEIFKGFRDAHTNYGLPRPYAGRIAFLPFLMEDYMDNGVRKFLVTQLLFGFHYPQFKTGVDITHWNGIPVERAVLQNADREEGSNPAARFLFGLSAMTVRNLGSSLPPDEEWVVITFRTEGESHEIILPWRVWDTQSEPRPDLSDIDTEADDFGRTALSICTRVQQVHAARKHLFVRAKVEASERAAHVAAAIKAKKCDIGKSNLSGINLSAVNAGTESLIPNVFEFAFPETGGVVYGYIRIRTFNHDILEFINEFIRILDLMPGKGVIIDVRSNGGGIILNGELLLQFLTPKIIEPEPAQFINTPLTMELCSEPEEGFDQEAADRLGISLEKLLSFADLRRELASTWGKSISQSIQTGAVYSKGAPITDPELANRFGQKYHGPIVLITDAQCYSTTDIFAAGFQDHSIGPILGVDANTGAGGANVFTHGDLLVPLLHRENSPIQPLPEGTTMRVAIRRTLRVGPNLGQPLEDLGVRPDIQHNMTRNDILNGNIDLIQRAMELLASQTCRRLDIELTGLQEGLLSLTANTENLDRLDLFIDGRPIHTVDVADGVSNLQVPTTEAAVILTVDGYSENKLVAQSKIPLG